MGESQGGMYIMMGAAMLALAAIALLGIKTDPHPAIWGAATKFVQHWIFQVAVMAVAGMGALGGMMGFGGGK